MPLKMKIQKLIFMVDSSYFLLVFVSFFCSYFLPFFLLFLSFLFALSFFLFSYSSLSFFKLSVFFFFTSFFLPFFPFIFCWLSSFLEEVEFIGYDNPSIPQWAKQHQFQEIKSQIDSHSNPYGTPWLFFVLAFSLFTFSFLIRFFCFSLFFVFFSDFSSRFFISSSWGLRPELIWQTWWWTWWWRRNGPTPWYPEW